MTELRPRYRRSPLGPRRLGIVVSLVMTLMCTLLVRMYYVQLVDDKPTQTANALHDGAVVIPAPRGLILDAAGRTLVGNTTVSEVTVDRDVLQERPDKGAAVLERLAPLIEVSAATLAKEITPCSPKVPAPCSTGQPFAPVPVASNVPTRTVLAISEHREQFPGVTVRAVSEPHYPQGSLAAHLLGYTGDVTTADTKLDDALVDEDTIGKSGLEQQYDSYLRGVDGKQLVQLNPQGYTVGMGRTEAAQQGDSLVTSIDLEVQKLVEKSMAQQIKDSRKAGKPATSAAVVVMDPNTGRIVASASYPTYDPTVFIGGISQSDYAALTSTRSGTPLLNRAFAGAYAPGSTFKLITSSSLVMHHQINTTTEYGCPGSLTVDGRVKTNYDSEHLGDLDLANALGYSCDTFFYRPTAAEYYADQARIEKGKKPHEWLQQMAAEYGLGRIPEVDVPSGEQAAGSYADRETRLARWKANRADYCRNARRGYPDVKDKAQREYLTQLASENCTDGWRYRAGDNADMSIGQGETTMSPLQLALAYSAMLNGGKIYEPTLARAVVDAKGKVVKTITPKVHNTVPVSQKLFNYIAKSLSFSRGYAVSGAFSYIGDKIQDELGGKTGTAEVEGKTDTSWLASWGSNYKQQGNARARFVVVGMVEQAGTGATAAGPMLKRIWDGLLGAKGKPVIPGGRPQTTLPDIKPQVQVKRR